MDNKQEVAKRIAPQSTTSTPSIPSFSPCKEVNNAATTDSCSCEGGICRGSPRAGFARRQFLKVAGLGFVSTALGGRLADAMAGPFSAAETKSGHLIPEDKKLSQEWVRSLFERGTKEIFRGKSLDNIGMPCGGIGTGQLYLCGDGSLGCWQIFNDAQSNWVEGSFATYKHRGVTKPVDQGFAVVVDPGDGRPILKTLSREGFAEVSFQGEYPIGIVRYDELDCPVKAQMEAFSPFMPLNAKDSALPATVFHITVENVSPNPVKASVLGWLQNAVCWFSARRSEVSRKTAYIARNGYTICLHSVEKAPEPQPINDAPPPSPTMVFEARQGQDCGTMALACTDPAPPETALHGPLPENRPSGEFVAEEINVYKATQTRRGLVRTSPATLAPGEKRIFTFVLAWHFPNQLIGDKFDPATWKGKPLAVGHEYTNRFDDAARVVDYVIENHDRLANETRLWRDAYYDSSLPYWLLDRLHSTASYLATGTCQWWKNGRFWAYEGVSCCYGTCSHVWNYAHAHARLFPELARNVRETQDFNPRENGGGFHPDTGLVGFRGDDAYAADGQCGTILKAYREHLMSADDSFLKRNWPSIKKAVEFSISHDANADGLIEDLQPNTYDINYFGANTFVGSLYLAALRAAEEMALEANDPDFAKRVRAICRKGVKHTDARLWNGEYFIQDVDLDRHPKDQYKDGCLSDQLFGQGWAHQLGLGYIYSQPKVLKALDAIWKYNWAPDVAPYNEAHKPFRWFVTPGQAGLITCTWPKGDYLSEGTRYREEVWTGIEYQVAGHMIWEGKLTEGLAICRAVHDRYHPDLFNPYNEVECGDHYARAMASWGVYLALAGFQYHGPKGWLGFAPRITPENYRALVTTAEGWITLEQARNDRDQRNSIEVRHGKLRITRLQLETNTKAKKIRVTIQGAPVHATSHAKEGHVTLDFKNEVLLRAGDKLEVTMAS
jgi:uncharacterized protein (DUF608 family)